MKTVYRVEHIAYRHGPYVSEGQTRRCQDLGDKMLEGAKNSPLRQPLPWNDGLEGKGDESQRYGFDSLDDLFNWFKEWLDDLEEHDYHVAVFNVDAEDVIVGGRQVIFPRKKYRRAAALRMEEVKR